MDCQEAQEQILGSLDASSRSLKTPGLERHLTACDVCRAFAEFQHSLDAQLEAAIVAPSLSPAFSDSVKGKIHRGSPSLWPEFLPDVAHVTGCIAATALCVLTLPFPPSSVILAGVTATLTSYVVQAVLPAFLQPFEEGEQ